MSRDNPFPEILGLAALANFLNNNRAPLAPWSEADEETKARARQAIASGDLSPNCDDPTCEFCNWVSQQPEWINRNASAAEAFAAAERIIKSGIDPDYAAAARADAQQSVPDILREAAGQYEAKNPLYGDAYKHYGSAMMAFFPQGLYLNEMEDWNRFGLFSMMVSKMHRIASNLTTGGHRDSAVDLSTYSAMMAELTEEK